MERARRRAASGSRIAETQRGPIEYAELGSGPAVLLQKTILATPPRVVAQAGAGERRRAQALLENILPVSARQQGLLNDAAIGMHIERFALERIGSRTLLLSLRDDLYGTFDNARYSAEHIPGARFVSYPSGGHVWIGHHADVVRELLAFLRPQ